METSAKPPVIAIGNFDGVHRGHQALLAAGKNLAVMEGRPLVAVTFEPHPRAFFAPDTAPFRITPASVKERALKTIGVDRVDVLDFNAVMAGLTAQQFIDMIIVDHLNVAHVVVGADFHFGKNRGGHVDTLQADTRFQTTPLTLEASGDAPISSTRIREALKSGDIAAASDMLGWDWEIEGLVEKGDQRGRELGFPTANIALNDTICPAYGIYAARVYIDGVWKDAAANIGIRPMWQVPAPLCEVYVFDFDGDLYGRNLRVQPIQKIRDEAKFETLEALKTQIAADCDRARAVLAAHKPG